MFTDGFCKTISRMRQFWSRLFVNGEPLHFTCREEFIDWLIAGSPSRQWYFPLRLLYPRQSDIQKGKSGQGADSERENPSRYFPNYIVNITRGRIEDASGRTISQCFGHVSVSLEFGSVPESTGKNDE